MKKMLRGWTRWLRVAASSSLLAPRIAQKNAQTAMPRDTRKSVLRSRTTRNTKNTADPWKPMKSFPPLRRMFLPRTRRLLQTPAKSRRAEIPLMKSSRIAKAPASGAADAAAAEDVGVSRNVTRAKDGIPAKTTNGVAANESPTKLLLLATNRRPVTRRDHAATHMLTRRRLFCQANPSPSISLIRQPFRPPLVSLRRPERRGLPPRLRSTLRSFHRTPWFCLESPSPSIVDRATRRGHR